MHKIYTHNWYNRNTITFAYGAPVPVTDKYSSSLYSSAEVSNFLSNHKSLEKELKNLIKSSFPKISSIGINIENSADTSYTDGNNIVVSNNFEASNDYDRLDILMASAFHEAAHCLYTDFYEIKRRKIYCNSLLQQIHNILEDEEIENRMGKNKSGYARYFGKLKAILLEQNGAGEKAISEGFTNNLDAIFTILFCLVRYPKHISLISENILDKYTDLFIHINDILINCNCPAAMPYADCEMYEESFYDSKNITATTVNASFEIYKYIQEYLAEDFENEKKNMENDPSSAFNKISGIPFPSSDSETKDGDKKNAEMQTYFRHDEIDDSSETGCNNFKPGLRVISPNAIRYNKLLSETIPYMHIASEILVFNEKKQKDVLVNDRFRRNGTLDTTKLADAMQNVNTVYTQKKITHVDVKNSTAKYAFVVMIDESGSMFTNDKKEEFPVKMAIMFYEILSKYSGIEFYVYGHGDRVNCYLSKERKNKYVLGNTDRQGNQDDAKAYKAIIDDVKRQTNLPIMVLNITDAFFCTSDVELRTVIDNFKNNNVSFNMLQVSHIEPKYKKMTERIMDGMVVELKNHNSKSDVCRVIKELATMVKKNFDKYNRK